MGTRISRLLAGVCVLAVSLAVDDGLRVFGEPARRAGGGADAQAAVALGNKKQSFDPKAQFEKGQKALQNGDLQAAEAAFQKVLAADPRSAGAYSNLGVIAMRRKDWDQALKLLQKAQKLQPHMAGIRLNIGLVEYRRGDYTNAIAPLESVVRDQPDSQQAHYLLGLCELFTQHWDKSVAALEPLWPQMSHDVTYLYVLGMAAHHAGEKELDEKALSQLIEIGSDAPEVHLIVAKPYLNHRDYDNAIAELNLAVAASPNLPLVLLNLGAACMRLNQYELADSEDR